MGPVFWIKRTVAVFVVVGSALFVVGLLKGRAPDAALTFAAGWSAITTAIFVGTRAVRSRRGEACALCQDTPRSMPLPPGAV